jgi:hypothetical protein
MENDRSGTLACWTLRGAVGLLVFVVLFAGARSPAQPDYGQVVLENRTGRTLDLSVDGHSGCRALMNLTCTSQERAGRHTLSAKGSKFEATEVIELKAKSVCTWTVKEDSTALEGCRSRRRLKEPR